MTEQLQDYERRHLEQVRSLAPECTLFLKRSGKLPLPGPCDIALYGSGARHTVQGGTGSGEVNSRFSVTVEEGLREAGFQILTADWLDRYDAVRKQAYAAFITRLREALNPLGCPVIVALAPKTSAAQRGLLYEAHDYALLGAAANAVFLMTYEWGYAYGPPMAVAPLGQVRAVLDYALTAVAPEKIFMGIPLYGYDWPLPFVSGETRAESLSPVQAVERALRHDIAIQYDAAAQAPYYHYTDRGGREHAVWFEDARSIEAKLRLADEYHLQGVGYWNLTRPFPQNWAVLASLFDIETLL